MKILAVDDNTPRMMHIRSIIPNFCEFEYVVSKQDALRKLSEKFYDLVIVDVVIPEDTSGNNISSDTGKSLIETIISHRRLFPPFQIVGVTVEEDSYKENFDFFQARLIPFLKYDVRGDGDQALLNLINRVSKVADVFAKEIDVAIITAVEDEYKEVLGMPLAWEDYEAKNSLTWYKYAELNITEEKKVSLVVAKLNEMGLVSAARQTECILNELHPKLVCMCGICAGIKGKVEKGDLIVAEKTWDYGNGKILPKEGGYYYNFDAEPNQIQLDAGVLAKIKKYGQECLDLANVLWKEKYGEETKYASNLRVGALPSGAAVVQDEKLIEELVIPQHRKSLGIDMETFAVYYACHCNKNSPKFISMKAVVDFADANKDDEYHEYASYISAHTLLAFVKKYFT